MFLDLRTGAGGGGQMAVFAKIFKNKKKRNVFKTAMSYVNKIEIYLDSSFL